MMSDDDADREERAIYLLAIIVLSPVVIFAGAADAIVDSGATICLIAVLLGTVGLAANLVRARRRPRPPRARSLARERR